MKKKGLFILTLLMTFLFSINGFAENVDSASNYIGFNGEINITKEVLGDIYSSGNNIIIEENVGGDVIAGGETIDIKSEKVNGNIRTLSRILNINSKNIKNITSGAQKINIGKNTSAKGLYLSGEEINFKGSCEGFYATGGTIIINGKVNGDVNVTCNEFIIADNGDITGKIKVKANKDPVVNSKVTVDDIDFTKINNEKTQNQISTFLGVGTVISLLASMLVGLVVYLIFKKFFINSDLIIRKEPLHIVLGGIASFILTPLVSMLLFITIIGLPLGIISLISYFIIVYLSPVISGIILGRLALKDKNPYLQVIVGILLIRALSLMPYLGTFIWVLSGMLSLGLITYEFAISIKYKEKKHI
ncbi:MAG: hypothetical protein RSG52_09145 [Terrisporobacter sp.]|uniref:hypothetical protein n=1 Tax=Terrisporobacter sp. TaxID=1965305 RepID=UPI002FCA2B81